GNRCVLDIRNPSGRVISAPESEILPGPEMVFVPAGSFWMGEEHQGRLDRWLTDCRRLHSSGCELLEAETPMDSVSLSAYYLDRFEVTNAWFQEFVSSTGYRTTAETMGYSWVQDLWGGKWLRTKTYGASWRAPTGPRSTTQSLYPVVHVTW